MFSLNIYCDSFIMSIMSFLMHRHAIGVPEGLTLLEFEEPSEQQQPTPEVQEVQPSGEVPDEVAVECRITVRATL